MTDVEDDPSTLDTETLDLSLWPVPDPANGDGSDQGESEDNDGRPGAVGGERSLARAYAKHGWDDDKPLPLRLGGPTNQGVTATYASPFYSARKGAKVRLGIFHTAEGARTVKALGSWFQRASANASSHTGIDDNDTARFVPDTYSAWTARSANPVAVQTELCGFAAWGALEWARHPGMLERAAHWAVQVHTDHGIPLVRLVDAQTKTGTGFCMHKDITVGWRDGSHTDCGHEFPIDAVLARAREIIGGDDMSADAEKMIAELHGEVFKRLPNRVGPNATPEGTGADTILGYSANADAYGTRIERFLRQRVDSRVAGSTAVKDKGLTLIDLWANTDAAAYYTQHAVDEAVGVLHEQADQIAKLTATVAGLSTALATIAASQGANPDLIEAAAKAGAEDALAGYSLKLSRAVSVKRTGRITTLPAPEAEPQGGAVPFDNGGAREQVKASIDYARGGTVPEPITPATDTTPNHPTAG